MKKYIKNDILEYNEELAALVHKNLPPDFFLLDLVEISMEDPEYFVQTLQFFDSMLTNEASLWEKAEWFFYACTEAARQKPDLCPVPDFCLLAFNMLASMGELTGQKVVCLDISLLPVALLAASKGAHITLTASKRVDALIAVLTSALPTTIWNVRQPRSMLDKGCLVLGQHPATLLEQEGLEVLRSAKSGVLFSYWDFLGVEPQSYAREKWLESGLVAGVLQLPRPRRQSAGYYPALILLGQAEKVRLAYYDSKRVGAGAWNQQEAVKLLCGAGTEERGMDVSLSDLYIKGIPDLTPRYHFSRLNSAKSGGKSGDKASGKTVCLGDVAHIIRCQLPRMRMDADELIALQLDPDVYTEQQGGLMSDGSFVCREMSLADLDPLTGFAMDQGGIMRVTQLNPEGRQGKYLLRQGDIVMSFRGTEPSIGSVGYWEFDGTYPAISGQSLCIVRAFGVDAIWLYYWLRSATARSAIIAKAVGSRMLTVNLADLRELPLVLPPVNEAENVHGKHREIVRLQQEIQDRRQKIQGTIIALVTSHLHVKNG